MKLYLLILFTLTITINAHTCQQVGQSSLGKLTYCKVSSPAPQLQWSINVTLLEDYAWKASDDVQYVYLTADDQPITENCYQGTSMKNSYKKGSVLIIEQLCFGFKPTFAKGSKVYIQVFSTQESGRSQVVYLSYSGAGTWQAQPVDSKLKQKILSLTKKNLAVQQE